MSTQDSLGVPASPSGSTSQATAIPNAVDELRKAIRLLNNAAYKCGETDGRDASITLQQKHAAASDAAFAAAMTAVDAAMTEAYAEGRKDERELLLEAIKAAGFELRETPDGHVFLLNVQPFCIECSDPECSGNCRTDAGMHEHYNGGW